VFLLLSHKPQQSLDTHRIRMSHPFKPQHQAYHCVEIGVIINSDAAVGQKKNPA